MQKLATQKSRRSKKTGLPPGSLVHVGEITHKEISISLIDYGPDYYFEKKNLTIEETISFVKDTRTPTWVNISGIHDPHVIEAIGNRYGFHSLLLEDIMNAGQRSKIDDYKDYLFIVIRMLDYEYSTDTVKDQQVSFILGNNNLITFLEDHQDVFDKVRDRIRAGNTVLRNSGADYLCYTLIDTIVDHYFIILEAVDDKLSSLEEQLVRTPTPEIMRKIQHLKREVVLLRKAVWPMRELLSNMLRMQTSLIQKTTQVYLQDVYDHTIQVIDTIESFRDIASGMLDIYLSNMSYRMNEIMKVLTIVSTIFVPLTFIASLYGMNFTYMPELQWRWGYPLTLLIMVAVGLFMTAYFRKKKWI